MAYKHGIYGSEIATSLVPTVSISAGLPVVFGTAPIHLAKSPALANKPVLCYTYAEAVEAFGYHTDWTKYTLCEFMKSHFALFNVAPVVFVNVLDSEVHKTDVPSKTINLTLGVGSLDEDGVLLATLVVKLTAEAQPLAINGDYTAAYDEDGKVVISQLSTGTIPVAQATLLATYTILDPDAVVSADIIGGVDITTGAYEGLELVNSVFPMFRLIPGQILAPGWSHDTAVAAVMTAKASNINGHFKCIVLTDVPTETVKKYTDVAAWKNDNNYVSERQIVCWPMVKLGTEIFHLSTQAAGIICKTDAANDDVPYVSPSNKSLQADGAMIADGTEINLGPDQAAYMNGQGIVTALNFIGGWKLWGNRTGCYPAVTDPKDAFIPIRRMFDWINNTLIVTFWQKVDAPLNKRLVDTILDSANIWLNGLAARQMIIGGRVVLLKSENATTDLMDGIIRFHVYVTPPGPAREIEFIIEYDPDYLATLFA